MKKTYTVDGRVTFGFLFEIEAEESEDAEKEALLRAEQAIYGPDCYNLDCEHTEVFNTECIKDEDE